MTEADWRSVDDPAPLLAFAEAQSSDRKLRLFALACCRAAGELVAEGVRREALDVAERHADGEASGAELGAAMKTLYTESNMSSSAAGELNRAIRCAVARRTSGQVCARLVPEPVARAVADAAELGRSRAWRLRIVPYKTAAELVPPDSIRDATFAVHRRLQAAIARDILRGPAAPSATAFAPWLSPTVVGVAEAIYHNRSYADLLILADALEEAGCDHAAVLGHCRGPGQHWRGCWVLDALTGRG